ncbi:hypothetical protein JB92DRAFT_3108430 [Gautieria morchelliformis]|nr:hypothetical protein JB92DRAFT_3108430 [Gautieria morchelliformis]
MEEFDDPSIEEIGTSEANGPHREDDPSSNAVLGIKLEEIPQGRGPASTIDGDSLLVTQPSDDHEHSDDSCEKAATFLVEFSNGSVFSLALRENGLPSLAVDTMTFTLSLAVPSHPSAGQAAMNDEELASIIGADRKHAPQKRHQPCRPQVDSYGRDIYSDTRNLEVFDRGGSVGERAPNTPRRHTSTIFIVISSGRRPCRVSTQPDPEDGDFPGCKKSRAPLRREFRDRRSLDGGPSVSSSTSTQRMEGHERTISPGVLVAHGAASPQSSGAGGTFSVTPTPPRAQLHVQPSTLHDSSRRVQHWSSADEGSLDENGNSSSGDDPDGRWQSRHAGSGESPLGGRKCRSVVGEGL